jgi:hypothetical protein
VEWLRGRDLDLRSRTREVFVSTDASSELYADDDERDASTVGRAPNRHPGNASCWVAIEAGDCAARSPAVPQLR